jgi:hypothetical protein
MKQTAKGEEIFESDAIVGENSRDAFIDALTYKTQTTDKECFITSNINPEEAFQVFNGKVFEISRNEYSVADSVERRVESPLQRYSRLKSELDELKFDLDSMVVDDKSISTSVWSILQSETRKLIAHTSALENHKTLVDLRTNIGDETTIPTASIVVDGLLGDVTRGDSFPAVGSGDREFLRLEQRIHQLETVLGYSQNLAESTAHANNKQTLLSSYPLVETISRLEQRVSMVDTAHVESLRVKTATLKNDLDAVSKAKTTSSASELKAVEAARKVEDLLVGVRKMEAVAEDLPALVLRLKTLERIHLSAGTFTSRLSQMEEELRGAVGDLRSNKEVLSALKEGFVENVAVMQQNVAEMETRFANFVK